MFTRRLKGGVQFLRVFFFIFFNQREVAKGKTKRKKKNPVNRVEGNIVIFNAEKPG